MSCYGDDGYYRRGSGFGYGTAFGYGLGFGSIHNGFRSQSCCSGGFGSSGPIWGYTPCGSAGGFYGCGIGQCFSSPYSFGTIAINAGCGTAIGTRATGLAVGPYASPCAPITFC